MEKQMTITTTTYKTHVEGFYVDVIKIKTPGWHELEAWIYIKDKAHRRMFTMFNVPERDFLAKVEGNIDKYVGIYQEEEMDA